MTVPILAKQWVCPNDCGSHATTYDAALPHHPCKRAAGLMIPLIPVGTRAKSTAHERQDYIGDELVRLDANGRPIMAVTTEHADGSIDCTIFAPTAHAASEGMDS